MSLCFINRFNNNTFPRTADFWCLLRAAGSSDRHRFSSEPSGQWARPSHTSFLRTHFLRSLHKKSSDERREVVHTTSHYTGAHLIPDLLGFSLHCCNCWTYLGFYNESHSYSHQIHQDNLFDRHRADFEKCTVMTVGRELKE